MQVEILVAVEDTTFTCGTLFLSCGLTDLDGAECPSAFESDSLEPEI